MKHMKRFVALFAALALVLAMAVPAFAVSGSAAEHNGSITIDNAVDKTTYKLYRIFDLESYDTVKEAYSYKLNSAWSQFPNYSTTIDGVSVSAAEFFTVDSGYIKWVDAKKNEGAEFAKLAMAFVGEKNIASVEDVTANGSTVSFTGLELGYYLVNSSLGVLCSLNTTAPNVTIKEKNGNSIIDKQVFNEENNKFEDENNAGIGDYVKFEISVTVSDGQPKKYVIHDEMSEGLTFVNDAAHEMSVTVNENKFTQYTLKTKASSTTTDTNCTFEIAFDDDTNGASVLKPNDKVVVTYYAKVNERANIGTEGNFNKAQLTYGDNHTTNWEDTKTYVWKIDIFKYTMKNGAEQLLENAQFVLYRGNPDNKEYAKIQDGKITGWTGNESERTVLTTSNSSKLEIKGLDVGTYYLEEIEAPKGYNKLTKPIEVKIADKAGAITVDGKPISDTTVKVENKAGTTLPTTGGIGTTIFYLIGGGLMVAAAVLLIAKKRMENK